MLYLQSLDSVAGQKDSLIFPPYIAPTAAVLTRTKARRLNDRSDSPSARFSFIGTHFEIGRLYRVQTVSACLVRNRRIAAARVPGSCAVVPFGSTAAQPARGDNATDWNHRCHHQLPPAGGQQAQSLGRPCALWPGVACRSQ